MKYSEYEGTFVLGVVSVLMFVPSHYVNHPLVMFAFTALGIFAFVMAVDLYPVKHGSEFLNSHSDRYGDDK